MISHPLFQKALPVLQTLEQHGFEAYFVGGCVRDTLLNKDISDIDIATNAYPNEIKKIFKKTIDVGIEHGTVIVLYHGETYEITTFRVESTYQDFRRPDSVTFVRDLKEDLKRRDFTVNAMALDSRGKIYDFHNGENDLKQRTIRAVGDATERFHEDALRMVRGIRFVAQLDFDMSPDTLLGIQENAHLLEKIAIERVRVEFQKMFVSSAKKKGIALLLSSQLYRYCPFLSDKTDALQRFANCNLSDNTSETQWATLLWLCFDKQDDMKKMLQTWKLSNKDIHHILSLLSILQFRKEKQWDVFELFAYGKQLSVQGEQLCVDLNIISQPTNVLAMYNALPITSVKDITINGNDIMACLNKTAGGSYIGEIMTTIKEKILLKQLVNDKQVLLNWVKKQYKDKV